MNAIIIDDEQDGRDVLKYLLRKNHPEINIVAEASNGLLGEEAIRKYNPDVVFLDVNMPLCDGFEMLGKFDRIDFDVVFTTAYNEYAIKAFKYSPFDFLLKPINSDELEATLLRLNSKIESTKQDRNKHQFLKMVKSNQFGMKKIAIASQEGFEVIDTENLIMLEADGSYTKFYLKNNTILLSSTGLGEYEDMLDTKDFMRIHKSFVVNLNEIKKYIKGDGGSVILTGDHEAFVSKRKKDLLLAIFR